MKRNSEAVEIARRYGFFLHRVGRHLVFRNAEGQQVVAAISPSDKRARMNVEHEFRRAIRRQQHRPPQAPTAKTV